MSVRVRYTADVWSENATPTVEQLRDLALGELLESTRWQTCNNYVPIVVRACEEAKTVSTANWQALALICFVVGLHFDADRDPQPFRTHGGLSEFDSASLSREQYEVLEAWLPHVEDPEMAARVADLLWTTKQGKTQPYLHGRTAVDKYLASAQRLAIDRKHWQFTRDRLRRAAVLAGKFQEATKVKEVVLNLLRSRGKTVAGFFDSKLMEVLLDFDMGDPVEWLPVSQKLAEEAEAELRTGTWGNPGPGLTKHLWEVTARWRIAQTSNAADEEARSHRGRGVEASIVEARHARKAGQPVAEAHFLQEAVRGLRKIGANEERVRELLGQICDAHRRTPTERFESRIDLTEHANNARDAVTGKPLKDAILGLAFIVQIPDKALLREMALDHLNKSVALKIASTVIMADDARVISSKPSMKGSDPDAALIEWQMREAATWLRMTAFAYIAGARDQLVLEHQVQLRDLVPLVTQSWLVPEGHERLFAQGFLAGFQGDYVTACHILVPQLENGLRTFVERGLGRILINQKRDGTQMAGLMNRILAVPELEVVLGEDLLFDLRGLLVEQDSVNLRNNLAHGLISDRKVGPSMVYFWWLCLRAAFLLISEKRSHAEKKVDRPSTEKVHKSRKSSVRVASKKQTTKAKATKKRAKRQSARSSREKRSSARRQKKA